MTVTSEPTNNPLGQFFRELQFRLDIVRRHKHQTDRYLATDFNVFSYIYDDENTLSDIIADLLRPDGKHGQGNKYLLAYLDSLPKFDRNIKGIDYLSALVKLGHENIRVLREKSTDNIQSNQRRMDIVIDFGGGYGLMIENKPWAIDQPRQMSNYYDDMKMRFQNGVILVYLSGNGDSPFEDSLPATLKSVITQNGEYIETNFLKQFYYWLDLCLACSEAEKMRWFLREFKDYIETKFS